MIPALLSRLLSPLADATVVFSFDRTGWLLHRAGFDEDDLRVDLSGRVCAVTGANSGLGEATALALAARGARVWLLCRDRARGEVAAARITQATANPEVFVEVVDLADLSSVRAFASRFSEERLDVLVNNAGVLPLSRQQTVDGLELTFATNVAGPFLLTALLLPRLRAATQGRIVTVSSGGMYAVRLDPDQWNAPKEPFDGVTAYAWTKRAEVILNELWAEKLAGTGVTCNAMHPGWADTPGVRTSLPRFHSWMKGRLRSAAEGADTAVWLAVAPRLAGTSGKFFFDRAERWTHWSPTTWETEADRAALWQLCERVTGAPGLPGA